MPSFAIPKFIILLGPRWVSAVFLLLSTGPLFYLIQKLPVRNVTDHLQRWRTLMISALKIRQRKFNFGQIPENMGTANLPLARKLGGIPPASEFYREICLFLLTCKSKCKFVRVNATAKFKNFDSLLQVWGNSLFNGVECVKINSIRQEIGKKAKNSQRSDCRLLFCKGKSHPWKFSVWHLKCWGLLLQQLRRQNNVVCLDFADIELRQNIIPVDEAEQLVCRPTVQLSSFIRVDMRKHQVNILLQNADDNLRQKYTTMC